MKKSNTRNSMESKVRESILLAVILMVVSLLVMCVFVAINALLSLYLKDWAVGLIDGLISATAFVGLIIEIYKMERDGRESGSGDE